MVTKTASSTSASITSSKFTIRPGRLLEASALGRLAAKTYSRTPLTSWLSPYQDKYYHHFERGFIQRAWNRALDPRNLIFVGVEDSNPSVPIAYAVFHRFGDDASAKRLIASQDRLWKKLLNYVVWIYFSVWIWMTGGDKSADPINRAKFEAYDNEHKGEYWEVEERKQRWHALSVVVDEKFQGKGIGKRLMAEAVARAEEQGVFIGLEASEPGEQLYLKVGFELLGRFREGFGENHKAGGVMLYTPKTMKEA